jgi:SAM-dependent methyltransferase
MVDNSEINAVKNFWSSNPMTFGKDGLETPEDVCNHAAAIIREKAWFGQEEGAIFSNLIDFDSLVGKRVLEIGHGVGWLAREFINAGAIYTGIDLSTYHHEICDKLFSNINNAEIILGNAEDLPFEDRCFDFIVSYGVIHHSNDTEQCIKEACRVLKKGSTFYLMLYRKSFLKYWYNKFFKFGVMRGELFKYKSINKVVEKHTDTHGEGGGAPISRHYTVSDLPRLFNEFSKYRCQVVGNYEELRGFPSTRFNIAAFLPLSTQQKILKKFGGYLNIWAVK